MIDIMDKILVTYRWVIMIVAGLALLYATGGILLAIRSIIQSSRGFEEGIIVLFIGVSILLSLGIPAILLKIMDDIKAMRKLQEEQAKKD